MFESKAFDVVKIRSVLVYMTDLKDESNAAIGHYGQTLNSFYYFNLSVSGIILNVIPILCFILILMK